MTLARLLLCSSTLLAVSTVAHADIILTANLTHSQETTQGPFLTSSGDPRPESFGFATFILNDARDALRMTATIYNIDVNGLQTPGDTNDDLTAAHIHAPAPPGQNAGVKWGFFGAPDNDEFPNDLVVIPFASGVGGTFTSKWDASEGNNTDLAAQIPNILAGLSYVNFHSNQFRGGEIRGQLVPEPSTYALSSLGILGLIAYRKRRS